MKKGKSTLKHSKLKKKKGVPKKYQYQTQALLSQNSTAWPAISVTVSEVQFVFKDSKNIFWGYSDIVVLNRK